MNTSDGTLTLTNPMTFFSSPPIVVAKIDDRTVSFVGNGEALEITLDEETLLTVEEWEYEVLNALNGEAGKSKEGLIEVVHDRFGKQIDADDLRALFRRLKAHELLDRDEVERLEVVTDLLSDTQEPESKLAAKNEAVGTSQQEKRPGLKLFRPMWLLRLLRPLNSLGPLFVFALPFLMAMAGFTLFEFWSLFTENFASFGANASMLKTLFLGLFSVNLIVTLVYAMAAFEMGATVNAITLRLFFGFLPRLGLWIDDTEKLSRRQAMWMHAAPLLTRLILACTAVLAFIGMRHVGGIVPDTALTVAAIATISLIVTMCPLIDSHGYKLLVEFLDEPKLRSKSFRALLNVFNRNHYQAVDRRKLAAFALTSLTYGLLIVGFAFFVFGNRLVERFGMTGLAILGLLLLFFVARTWAKLKETNRVYWRNYRFERWRDMTLPSQEQRRIATETEMSPWRVLRQLAIGVGLIALFYPYTYRPTGAVTLLPTALNQLSTDIDGIVEEVNFEGGQFLAKDTIVAQLATDDLEAQVRIREAEMREATTILDFTNVTCERNQTLFESDAISDVQLQRALAECAKAEAEIEIIAAEIDRLKYRIERSVFRMPFDGTLGTLYLNERLGSFLPAGEPIASVRDLSEFRVRMNIREVDLAFVDEGDQIEVRVYAYPNEVFTGSIESIHSDVKEATNGQVVEMVGSIANRDGLLKSGMTGVAKTPGTTMPVYEILTRGFYRFFVIDLWAWLP